MAKSHTCPNPGCDYKTDVLEAEVAISFLELHVSQVHGLHNKPKKTKNPDLEMTSNVVDNLDWEAFVHQFNTYKKLAGITGDGVTHLLACLGKEVYRVLFSAFGSAISDQNEQTLKENIIKLVVRKKNCMLSVMEMLALKQESDERIVNFVSRVKAKARQCEINITCSCGRKCDYTDQITLHTLIAGLPNPEIQEELLVIDVMTLEEAEQRAITKESAKYS